MITKIVSDIEVGLNGILKNDSIDGFKKGDKDDFSIGKWCFTLSLSSIIIIGGINMVKMVIVVEVVDMEKDSFGAKEAI